MGIAADIVGRVAQVAAELPAKQPQVNARRKGSQSAEESWCSGRFPRIRASSSSRKYDRDSSRRTTSPRTCIRAVRRGASAFADHVGQCNRRRDGNDQGRTRGDDSVAGRVHALLLHSTSKVARRIPTRATAAITWSRRTRRPRLRSTPWRRCSSQSWPREVERDRRRQQASCGRALRGILRAGRDANECAFEHSRLPD
jgi:hypothetical protein